MEYLVHTIRDTGRGPAGSLTSPSCPDSMSVPGKTPGTHGIHDAAHLDIVISRSGREHALSELQNTANAVQKSRHEITHTIQQKHSSATGGTASGGSGPPNQNVRTIAHANMQPIDDASGWIVPPPDWLPADKINEHVALLRNFDQLLMACSPREEDSLGGVEGGSLNLDVARSLLCHVYALASEDLVQPINTSRFENAGVSMSLFEVVRLLRQASLYAANATLIAACKRWRGATFSTGLRLDVSKALALFNAMLCEYPYSRKSPPPAVIESLNSLKLANILYRSFSMSGSRIILLTEF